MSRTSSFQVPAIVPALWATALWISTLPPADAQRMDCFKSLPSPVMM
jgi:hypothetical protein